MYSCYICVSLFFWFDREIIFFFSFEVEYIKIYKGYRNNVIGRNYIIIVIILFKCVVFYKLVKSGVELFCFFVGIFLLLSLDFVI